ncbi:MAG: site-specific integrase [Acidaminococcaceae bacterium]
MGTSKEPIRLRKRKTATENVSLYLDIYINGKRSYEYLKMYLVPEKTKADKDKNRQTLQLAEAIKAKKIIELQNGEFGFNSAYKLETNFLDYYRVMCEKRHGNPESRGNWYSCLKHLERFCDSKMTFADVTPAWIEKFRTHLDKKAMCRDKRKHGSKTLHVATPLSQNTKQSYFNKLRACINQAFEDRIIPHNPLRGIEGFKDAETERLYLTLNEVRAMAATECKYPALKDAYLFACLTGLRKSDIEKMRWSEVQQQGEFTRIIFKQKKTGGQEYLDISPQAVQYMGERRKPDDPVFVGFKYSAYMNVELRMWAMRAGVVKDLTFHSSRHTFAVLMLDLGTDIYTVSKLLGHREIKTTQIYAKVLDKNKQSAVSMIPSILPIDDIL